MILKKSSIIIIIMIFTLLIGCSTKEKEQKNSTAKAAKAAQKIKKEKPKNVEIPRSFVATKYSDGVLWENGINKKAKNQFIISIAEKALNPIKTGYKLKFAAAGETVVTKVGRQDNKGYSSIFITVDKNLDPVKDGNPNPIYIKSIQLQPCRYSKPGEWQNGIQLIKPGLFFFTIERMDQTPIKIGDLVKFAKSGEAAVKAVSRRDRPDNFSDIFVTVDKSLDWVADGYPNPITIMITN